MPDGHRRSESRHVRHDAGQAGAVAVLAEQHAIAAIPRRDAERSSGDYNIADIAYPAVSPSFLSGGLRSGRYGDVVLGQEISPVLFALLGQS
jgi:hypothetical protein